MPVITVVTPVHDGGDTFLGDTFACLSSQSLPHGWGMQWLLQEDGQTGRPLEKVPDTSWISKGSGRRGGAAWARTMALPRAEGALLRCLDADDLLPDAHTLARDIEVLTERPDVGWVAAPCLDLMPDGSLRPGPNDPEPGPLPPRALLDGLIDDACPVMCTTVTLHTDLVRAIGAWPALPAAEDMALPLAAEAVSPGWMQEEPGELYRKHPDQTTATPEYLDPTEFDTRKRVLIDHAEALHRTGWRWTPSQPLSASPHTAEADRPMSTVSL
ncbi:GltA [Actinomadura sp. KC345]|nr:GltA [Actinomadura sp. KC345]